MHPIHAQGSGSVPDVDIAPLTAPFPLSQEDQARADLYGLLSRLLIAAPDTPLLAGLAAADSIVSEQDDYPLDIAWEKLTLTAAVMDAHAVTEEFNALFISTGTPQINPYASRYLSGFLNEKPLAALRTDLAALGLARLAGVGETEDHLAALCDTMRLLITGLPGTKRHTLEQQKRFFTTHIASWSERCFDDIRATAEANFYRQVANFMQAFFAVEAQAFDMEDATAAA